MDATSARALQQLARRPCRLPELAGALTTSYSRTASIARGLVEKGYAERTDGVLQLAKTAKAEVVKSLSGRYSLETLLADARGRILPTVQEPKTTEAILKETGLSQSAVYAALRKLSGLGAVVKRDSRYRLADDTDLISLASILAHEERASSAEPFATIMKTSMGQVLKRVSRGIPPRGSLTGLSLFGRFGVEYLSPYDYYVDPPEEPSLESVLVHALASSQSRTDRTICAILVARNKARLDLEKARKLAERWDVLRTWLDANRLADGKPLENPDRFLPWKEYAQKAELYDVPVTETPGSQEGLVLLNQLGARIDSPTEAYLFGGGNMLLRGLKAATRDIDLLLEDRDSFQLVVKTLTALGFRPMAGEDVGREDRRLEPSGVFVAEDYPRVDLFTRSVLGKLVLTDSIRERAEERRFQKLIVKLLSLEDVFLFKSVTDRVGDLDDMAVIIRRAKLDWRVLLKTYLAEEKLTGTHFCFTILDNLEILQEKEGIRVPIHRALLQHCMDASILEAVKRGATTVGEIKKLVDFPEYRIRNRIRTLLQNRRLKKQPGAKGLRLTTDN